MSQKEFENKIKSIIYPDTAEVNTDKLWRAIRKKKKRRILPIWWMGGLLVIAAIGMAWFLYPTTHQYTTASTSSEQRTVQDVIDHVSNQELTPIDRASAIDTNSESPNHSINTAQASKKTSISSSINPDRSTEKSSTNKSFFQKNKTHKTITSKSAFNENIRENNLDLTIIDNWTSEKIRKNENTTEHYNLEQNKIKNISITNNADLFGPHNISIISTLEPNRVVSNHLFETINYPITSISPPANDLPIKNTSQSAFTLEIYASYLNVNRMSDPIPTQPDAGWTFTHEYIEPLEHWQLGISTLFRLSQKLYVSAGLNYGQSTERIERNWTVENTIIGSEQPIEITYLANGEIDTLFGDPLVGRKINSSKIHNRIRSINIPVSLGYISSPIVLGIQARLEAGLSFNIRSSMTGQVFEDDDTLVNLSDRPILKDRLGVQYYARFGAMKSINQHWSLGVLSRFQLQPKSVSAADYPRRIRYTYFGIDASILYRF